VLIAFTFGVLSGTEVRLNGLTDAKAERVAAELWLNTTCRRLALVGNPSGGTGVCILSLVDGFAPARIGVPGMAGTKHFGEAGCRALSEALHHNSTLVSLDVQCRYLGDGDSFAERTLPSVDGCCVIVCEQATPSAPLDASRSAAHCA
jgi:hypothetical protein